VCLCLAAVLSTGCNTMSRHKALTLFFDGVPPPKMREAPATPITIPDGDAPPRQTGYREHGPFAAKLCSACHEAGGANALVAPKDELCFRCHELGQERKYVHGPLASGGCLVCHDPHSSRYRYLLVSESDNFCFRCHDRGSMEKIEGHGDPEANCTLCHDAHGSDTKYLLK